MALFIFDKNKCVLFDLLVTKISKAVKKKFLGENTSTAVTYPDYGVSPNPELYQEFTRAELDAALDKLTRNTTPGKDRITNHMLRNTSERIKVDLLGKIIFIWESGRLPAMWKHADVTMLPKPNKPLGITNIRLISLTSCAGKLMEHMVVDRLTSHMEDPHGVGV